MAHFTRLLVCTAGILLLGGCFIPYMMVRGTSEPLQLASNPSGATASVSAGSSCQTPCQLDLARDSSVVVTFSKLGCKQQLVSVFPTMSGSGIFMGGMISEMAGSSYNLQPNPAVVNLDCVDQPVAANPTPLAPIQKSATAVSMSTDSSPVPQTAQATAASAKLAAAPDAASVNSVTSSAVQKN
jgi:hypothetical protein